jgi:hypothetical protein
MIKVYYKEIDELANKYINNKDKIETLDDFDFKSFFYDLFKLINKEDVLINITEASINNSGLSKFIYVVTNKSINKNTIKYSDEIFLTVYQSQECFEYFKLNDLEQLNKYLNN